MAGYSAAHDLAVLASMAGDFDEFIKSDVVFWQLTDDGAMLNRYPKLTVAGVLFCMHKLQLLPELLAPAQHARCAAQISTVRENISAWRANIERKAVREFAGRLRSWSWFVDEAGLEQKAAVRHYAQEAYGRTYLHLLLELLQNHSTHAALAAQVASCDMRLRSVWAPARFVWDAQLQPAFPADVFWFLYGVPDADAPKL